MLCLCEPDSLKLCCSMMLNSDEADGGVFIVSGVVLSQEME